MSTQLSPDLLAAAKAAPGFMPDDEGRALYEAALAVAVPGPLLEVGSWMGKSALYLAAARRSVLSCVFTRRILPEVRSSAAR